ncbi:hypothetical protein L596_029714 [Steinernema carpocapsae]|uniref:Metalloendopeptidase n=1 Tax=Steinernema carpocapsae TaxID=34508 RepID=A0A4U5LQK7_STECR|nr:hypothetical protein L596_029714 [Steinernema carpocapsae]
MMRQMLDQFNEDPTSVPPWVFRRIQRFCFNHIFAPRCQKLLHGGEPDLVHVVHVEEPDPHFPPVTPPPPPLPMNRGNGPLPPQSGISWNNPRLSVPENYDSESWGSQDSGQASWNSQGSNVPSSSWDNSKDYDSESWKTQGQPNVPPPSRDQPWASQASVPPALGQSSSVPFQVSNPFPSEPMPPQGSTVPIPEFLLNHLGSFMWGELPNEDRQMVLKSCNGPFKCKETHPEDATRRASIAKDEISVLNRFNPKSNVHSVVEARLNKIQQVKLELLNRAGLGSQVTPANDGTFEHDILLTEDQSTALLEHLKSKNRTKRYAIFLEGYPTQTWEKGKPIVYSFDPSIQTNEQAQIKDGLAQIEANTCLRFQFAENRPNDTFIYYVKTSSTAVCGLSFVGRVSPVNSVYLSFKCPNPVGIAMHETLHALGVAHQHLRGDRDEHVKIDWSNINPQYYDQFVQADSKMFTTYGVPYDYYSIMHYSAYVASINPQKPSIIPKRQSERFLAIIGQRKNLSDRDVELLNAMYCSNECVDKNVYCGSWALKNLCQTKDQIGWMKVNCQKSCGFCR